MNKKPIQNKSSESKPMRQKTKPLKPKAQEPETLEINFYLKFATHHSYFFNSYINCINAKNREHCLYSIVKDYREHRNEFEKIFDDFESFKNAIEDEAFKGKGFTIDFSPDPDEKYNDELEKLACTKWETKKTPVKNNNSIEENTIEEKTESIKSTIPIENPKVEISIEFIFNNKPRRFYCFNDFRNWRQNNESEFNEIVEIYKKYHNEFEIEFEIFEDVKKIIKTYAIKGTIDEQNKSCKLDPKDLEHLKNHLKHQYKEIPYMDQENKPNSMNTSKKNQEYSNNAIREKISLILDELKELQSLINSNTKEKNNE